MAMSLRAVTEAVLAHLQRARELFGPAPRAAAFASTGGLSSAGTTVAAQLSAATAEWHGTSSGAYSGVAAPAVGGVGRVVESDAAASAGMTAAGVAARDGASAMDGIIADTRRGIAAIAPITDTPAERMQLVEHLQTQLNRAQVVVDSASQQGATLSGQISTAATGYRIASANPAGIDPRYGPDDVIVGNGSHMQGSFQMVDNGVPTPPPAPPVTGDPIKLPPALPLPVQVIDASPPDAVPTPAPKAGFPKCDNVAVVKDWAEIIGGGLLFGASIPADLASLGAATPGLVTGAWGVGDGADNLRRCK